MSSCCWRKAAKLWTDDTSSLLTFRPTSWVFSVGLGLGLGLCCRAGLCGFFAAGGDECLVAAPDLLGPVNLVAMVNLFSTLLPLTEATKGFFSDDVEGPGMVELRGPCCFVALLCRVTGTGVTFSWLIRLSISSLMLLTWVWTGRSGQGGEISVWVSHIPAAGPGSVESGDRPSEDPSLPWASTLLAGCGVKSLA